MFSLLYQDLLVIDLSCGFGWCGSPAYYAIAGKLTNHILRIQSRSRSPLYWQHMFWDPLLETRISLRNRAAESIGQSPPCYNLFSARTCLFQRLQSDANILPRFGARAMSSVARDDLRWFQAVLQHPERFNSIPLAHFAELSDPNVHIFMDASSEGLCALDPLSHRYLHQQLSKDESEGLSINVLVLRSAVLAALRWGPRWHNPTAKSLVHVQFHIDNTSAVTWANQRPNRHHTELLYNRLLSLAEFQYNLVCTASHISVKVNVMEDAGSRSWRSTDPLISLWANMCSSWTQDTIETPLDDLFDVWDRCSSVMPRRSLPQPSIGRTGDNGVDSLQRWAGFDGSCQQTLLADSGTLPLSVGHKAQTADAKATNTALSISSLPA
ncbi:Hypothetical protein PHPALM_8965 [Phytophthora palmivora]|uniref:Uncharacterized protein n=1 Tax=Phytophthora palmivora TaxID=4796 RepID=A0A2P4Y8I9_9STRA|nr:Hypothetical protein PHPALM_8965 [Phytophthora palmivora]